MRGLIITESEKRRILNMHNKKRSQVFEGVIIDDGLTDRCINTYYKAPGGKQSNKEDFDQTWHVKSVNVGKKNDESTGWGAIIKIELDGAISQKCIDDGYSTKNTTLTDNSGNIKTGSLTIDCRKMDESGNLPLDYVGPGASGIRYNKGISEVFKEYCISVTTSASGSGNNEFASIGGNQGSMSA
jgi:hypothetical protein